MTNTAFPFECLKCKSHQYIFSDWVTCSGCGFQYPVVEGIPILINQSSLYIAESFYLYYGHIRSVDNQVIDLESNFLRYPERNTLRDRLIEAMRANQRHIGKITDLLKSHLAPADLLDVQINPHNDVSRSLKDFDYLRRDWSGNPESELQIEAIVSSLAPAIMDLGSQNQSCLVLGAGTGRIGNEVSPYFGRTYATDLSFSMAYHFNEVVKNNISFYEINTANVISTKDYVRKIESTYLPPAREIQQSSQAPYYFVSDVQQLPMQSGSMSCVLSVYFTDVIALRLWIGEIRRVLKKGGIFVHFGPLGYPFKNIAEKLSAQDVRRVFEESNFTVLQDFQVETPHLASSLSMARTVYDNWVFVARNDNGNLVTLGTTSIPFLKGSISYELLGSLPQTERQTVKVKLFTADMQTITGSTFLIDILKNIDGRRTISEIFHATLADYDVQEYSESGLITLFETLKNHGVIGIGDN